LDSTCLFSFAQAKLARVGAAWLGAGNRPIESV
jgi:hypothetical protein